MLLSLNTMRRLKSSDVPIAQQRGRRCPRRLLGLEKPICHDPAGSPDPGTRAQALATPGYHHHNAVSKQHHCVVSMIENQSLTNYCSQISSVTLFKDWIKQAQNGFGLTQDNLGTSATGAQKDHGGELGDQETEEKGKMIVGTQSRVRMRMRTR
jgi:hypothetical protein